MKEYYIIHIYYINEFKEGYFVNGIEASSKKEIHKYINEQIKKIQEEIGKIVVTNINIF